MHFKLAFIGFGTVGQGLSEILLEKTEMLAKKYDFADEIAMSKKAVDDEKKIAYEEYVSQCIAYGDKLKEAIGY